MMEFSFLDLLVGKSISVFILGGTNLKGQLVEYDEKAIVIKRNDERQLVYKHSISTVSLDNRSKGDNSERKLY